MLSPRQSRIVLLPQDRELIALLGCTEEEYRWFCKQARYNSKIQPGTPTADLGVSIALFVIGVALSVASSLLAPKPKVGRQQQASGGRIVDNQVQGQDIVDGRRFAPKSGFDTIQNVVEMGSTIPLIYCKREEVNGEWYGGIRINTNLLWSQLLTDNGTQFLRSIFLVGEGDSASDAMQLDVSQFAIGNNLLGSYDLAKNSVSRLSIYYNQGRANGRIIDDDHIAGTAPSQDPGRADKWNVYGVDIEGDITDAFVSTQKPSTQTQFGLYGLCGNGLGLRTNPNPQCQYSITLRPPAGQDVTNGFTISRRSPDLAVQVQRLKDNDHNNTGFPIRSYISYSNGSKISYTISKEVSRQKPSNGRGIYQVTASGSAGVTRADLNAEDLNARVETLKQSYDENLLQGELYKIGSCLCICYERDEKLYDGTSNIVAKFDVVRAQGVPQTASSASRYDVTERDQIYRIAIATFITEQPGQIIEIGIRSTLGHSISGLVNGLDEYCSYSKLDNEGAPNNIGVAAGQDFNVINPQIGRISKPDVRTSYFSIGFRPAGSTDEFTTVPYMYGISSETGQSIYNSLRFEMPAVDRWEFRIEPMSSREVKTSSTTPKRTIDYRLPEVTETTSFAGYGDVTIRWNGSLTPAQADMVGLGVNESQLQWRTTRSLTVNNGSALAEFHPLSEITSTFGSAPEHEVVYVNCIQPNNPDEIPNYENLAILGLNIRSSREFATLQQFSVYMNSGLGNTHSFPDVLQDLLTSSRYGTGQIVSPAQIDTAAFAAAKTFTDGRRYFFDGIVSEKTNIRSWASEVAGYYLLDFVIRNGKFSLQPIVEFTQPEPITGLFTAGNIIDGSMELTYFDQEQRQPPRVSVKWREERRSDSVSNKGLFPIVREITVRESDPVLTAIGYSGNKDLLPLEEIDISDYCTSEAHAVDLAKFTARFRRLSTHQIKFKTTVDQAALDLGKCFRLGMETLVYENPRNGYITEDGTIVSWPEYTGGNFRALVWDGSSESLEEVTIRVSGGKATDYQGHVFCAATTEAKTQTYKVQSLAFDEDGNIDVEAIHWPTLENGFSKITESWNTESYWVIEGEIGDTNNPIIISPPFSGVDISGPPTTYVGLATAYTAEPSGGTGFSYDWTPNGSAGTAKTSNQTWSMSGSQDLQCVVTSGGVSITGSRTVNVVAAPSAVVISGPTELAYSGSDIDVVYSAQVTPDLQGTNTYTYLWSEDTSGTEQSTTLTVDGTGDYTIKVAVTFATTTIEEEITLTVTAAP